jgi:hypothetical protein
VRIEPDRVLLVERVLRWLRVIGSLPEPVRVELLLVRVLAVVAGAAGAETSGAAAAAIPQTLQ